MVVSVGVMSSPAVDMMEPRQDKTIPYDRLTPPREEYKAHKRRGPGEWAAGVLLCCVCVVSTLVTGYFSFQQLNLERQVRLLQGQVDRCNIVKIREQFNKDLSKKVEELVNIRIAAHYFHNHTQQHRVKRQVTEYTDACPCLQGKLHFLGTSWRKISTRVFRLARNETNIFLLK